MEKHIRSIKDESNLLIEKNKEELHNVAIKLKKEYQRNLSKAFISQWFALVQEISFRTIGLKHFNTQLLAGAYLFEGNVVEMKTGEGKSLVSTLPITLNALSKNGVHVVTVNDYLAERDQKLMGKIYKELELSAGLIKAKSNLLERQKGYQCDITYLTNSELVFDYLKDNSTLNKSEITQRSYYYCLLDEIDSILVDEARMPIILSISKKNKALEKLYKAKAISKRLELNFDFQLNEKKKEISLSTAGYLKISSLLKKESLFDLNDPWILEILKALKASYFFQLNKDYILLNKKIVIIDEFSGRLTKGRRWSTGLHEAIEVKEEILVENASQTKSSITYQNFFSFYPILSGMSGTAKIIEKEFEDIYKLNVVLLPTIKSQKRIDASDLIYQTELVKWKKALSFSKNCFKKGQPLLIGTSTIEKSEFLSKLFNQIKMPHVLLNAKPENIVKESEIIAQAGERFSITIATNMAGRGTDILLGGSILFQLKLELIEALYAQKNLFFCQKITLKLYNDFPQKKKLLKALNSFSSFLEDSKSFFKGLYLILLKKIETQWSKENTSVKNLGGLFILGTERHETRRIDDQLRGRAGRQGDPGISQFFLSLEDDLIYLFGGKGINRWITYLMEDMGNSLDSPFLSNAIGDAQKKIELTNYDVRKNTFQYDTSVNVQRNLVFQFRKQFILENVHNEIFLRFDELTFLAFLKKIDPHVRKKIEKFFGFYISHSFTFLYKNNIKRVEIKKKDSFKIIWCLYQFGLEESDTYQSNLKKKNRNHYSLLLIDSYWSEHIEQISFIRETINWKAYGQKNPLVEYNLETLQSFKTLIKEFCLSMLYFYSKSSFNYSQ